MDRAQIEGLKVGVVLERTFDLEPLSSSQHGQPKPNARWSFRGEVTKISYRGVSVNGKAYVGGYTRFGTNGAEMSFSVHEGQGDVRIVPTETAAA